MVENNINITQEELKRLEVIYEGIKFKKNREEFSNDTTWESLNEKLGNHYANGESFRCAVKDFQRSLRSDLLSEEEEHEDALPRVSTDTEKIFEIESKKLELQKEKVKLSSIRLDLNKAVRETARTELLLEEIQRAIEKASENHSAFQFQRLQKQKDDTEYVLAFADAHFGKEFETFFNSYNIETAYKRFNELYNEVHNLVLEKHINTLHVINLGDMIEGLTLRVSQIQSVQIGLVDQTIGFMEFFAQWLEKLSEVVNIKYYQVKSSNHSQIRPFGAKPNEFVKEDMERIVLSYLKGVIKKNPRIEIVENDARLPFPTFNLFGFEIISLHGHEHKNYNNLLKDIAWKYRKFYDYGFVGHIHVNETIASGEGSRNNCELIRVPSMMGTDEYADSLLVGNKAGATLVEFNSRQGKRSITDIILN